MAAGGPTLCLSPDLFERMQASFSHAGRNQLGGAMASLELLESILPGEVNLRDLRTSLERVLGLFARLEQVLCIVPARAVPLDLAPFLAEVADRHGLAFEGGDEPARILTDPDLLAALLGELCANIHDIGAGARIRVLRDPLRIEVEDDGPGVGEEELELLGEAFVTTKMDRLGLGLHRVRRLCESLTMALDWRNRPGGGFAVTLSPAPGDKDS